MFQAVRDNVFQPVRDDVFKNDQSDEDLYAYASAAGILRTSHSVPSSITFSTNFLNMTRRLKQTMTNKKQKSVKKDTKFMLKKTKKDWCYIEERKSFDFLRGWGRMKADL